MPKVMIRELEKLDFRTKEAYKNAAHQPKLYREGLQGDFPDQLYAQRRQNQRFSSSSPCLWRKTGRRRSLVDADLRKSVLRRRYRTGHEKYGLSHYLSGQAELEDASLRNQRAGFPYYFCGAPCRQIPANCWETSGFMPFCRACGKHTIM